MRRIIDLTAKNLKLLVRSKSSALIILLGPLFMIFIAGLAFDNANLYQFKIGTYSDSYSSLSNSFVSKLSDSEYSVTRFDSKDECIGAVKSGEVHACLVFSGSFDYVLNNDIDFYVDQSRINIAGTVLDTISSDISERTGQISEELTQKLIDAFDMIETEASSKKSVVVALTSDNDVLVKSVEQTQNTLNLLEFNVNKNDFKTSELATIRSNLSGIMGDLVNVTQSRLDSIISDLVSAYDDFADINLSSSERIPIEDALIDAINGTARVRQDINDSRKLSRFQLNMLVSLIDNVNKQINSTATSAERVRSARDATLKNLAAVKKGADDSLIKILELQKSFNSIQQTISDIEVTDPGTITQPINTKINPVITKGTYLDFIFPALIMLVLMFTALLLAPTLVVLERKSSAYFRNFISPVSDVYYVISTFVTCFIILVVQVLIIIGISAIVFSSELTANILTLSLLLFFLISVFTLIGMIVGYLSGSQEMAVLTSIIIGSILLFLSDVLVPLESIPETILSVVHFNPFFIGSSNLRQALLFNARLDNVGSAFSVLGGFLVILIFLVYGLHLATKRGSLFSFILGLFKRRK